APDLLERLWRAVAVQPVAELDHLLLPTRELRNGLPKSVLAQADLDLLLEGRALAGEELAERGAVVVAERTIEARHRARGFHGLANVLERETCPRRDLLVRGLPAELDRQVADRAIDALLALDDVRRDADRARLVGDSALNGLADPPRRIGREL